MAESGLLEALDRVRAVGPILAKCAAESEDLGCLAPAAIDALHETGLLRMVLPADLGGLDLTIPESIEVCRAVSAYDGSSGWTFIILADGPLFARLLVRPAFEELFADPRSAVCGSANPLGAQATVVEGGYSFTGVAGYASGCRHADWLYSGAWVQRDGSPSFVDGQPELIAGVMPMAEARIEDTWNMSGMRATGSNDCTFDGVFVPEARTFGWFDPVPHFDVGVFGRIPLLVQLGGGLAGCVVGIARGALDRFLELAAAKTPLGSTEGLAHRSYAHMAVGEAEGLILAAEDTLGEKVRSLWSRGVRGEPFDDAIRVSYRLRAVTAVRLAGQAVDLLHDAAGMDGVKMPSALERAWRDVHTASQHTFIGIGRVEMAGRRLLGVDPGSLVI
jgi:alkylation response protein AidB-like acyl-CoA dehydrogenase